MPRPTDSGSGRKRKKVVRKKGAREVEAAARAVDAFVKGTKPRIKAAPKVRQVRKAAAVTVARSGERNSRKLPVAVPKTKGERDAMVGAVAGRDTVKRNRTAGEAVRVLNERSTRRVVLSDPKRAKRQVQKDAIVAALQSGERIRLEGTPLTGKARARAIRDVTSGKPRRIKAVGPFTRAQLEREGAVKRVTTNSQLPSPLRRTKYEKPARKGTIKRAMQDGASQADANALKALDIAARPFYAGAAAATAAAKGKDVGKAAKRGLQGKEKASYRDALRAVGAPKVVADTVGTVGDFVLDPTNLVGGKVATTAAKAGEKAARNAAKRGATEAVIRKARLDAMRAVENSGKNKLGVDLTVAGKSVPLVRKKVRDEGRGRNAVNAVNPRSRPKGVRESDHVMLREASTTARAFRDEALNETRRISRSAGKNVQKKDVPDILNAIERQDFTGLSADVAAVASRVDKHMKKWAARRKEAGLDAEIKTGYVPHMTPKSLREDAKPPAQGGSAFSRTVTDHRRKDKRTIREQNEEFADAGLGKKFEDEDLPLLLAAHGAKGANTVAKARFNKQIAEDAPTFKRGDKLRDGEGVYWFDQGSLRKLDADDLVAVSKGKHDDKRLVRVDDEAYQRFVDDLKPLDRTGAGVSYDKANAAWKRLALATPGFYVRNLIGEATMGYMGTTGARGTARYTKAGLKDSPKVLKRVHERERAQLDALDPKKAPLPRSTRTIKVKGEDRNLDDFIDQARADGVLRKGQQGNELRELQDGLGEGASVPRQGKRAVVAREKAHSFASDIEDVWRLASYKANLDAGMSRTEARRKALDFHFDYGELSRFERQARRVLPFYCVPDDHEILTRRGFKRHVDLTVGEDVMALNHDTGVMEWVPLLEVATFDYDGPLKTMEHRGTDFAFTDDHRWPVVGDPRYGSRRKMKRAHELVKTDRIPLTGEFVDDGTSALTPRQAAILGWLVGDGYFRWRGNSCEMLVYQSPKKHLDRVRDLLGHDGRNPHPQTGVVAVPVAREDRNVLVGAGFRTKDDLLKLIGRLSREAAEAMWQAMFDAEGSTAPATGQQTFAQVDGPVLEAFQMLSYMTGRACNVGQARTTPGWGSQPTRTACIRKDTHAMVGTLGERHYNGTIWCPRTEHGTWVMRHNGKVIVTGNTFNSRALEMYSRAALTSPKKLSAIEKSRETVQDVTGAGEDWEKGAKEYQKRQVPIVARVGGKDLMLQAGLPVGLLNELPLDAVEGMAKLATGDVAGAAAAAKDQTSEWFLFTMGLVTPFVKAPIEIGANRSYFFRGDIEPKGRRLVAAPDYLKPLKGSAVGDLLGLAMIKDKRTGRMVLGYRGKADYLIRQIPGIPAILNRLAASGTNRRGQDQTLELIAALTGINPDPVDKVGASFESLYDEREKVDNAMGDLRQQDRADSAEYRRLQARKRELDDRIGQAKVERGDADAKPAGKKRVRKRRSSGSSGSLWGGGSSGSSSGGSSGSMWGGSSSGGGGKSSSSSSMWGN